MVPMVTRTKVLRVIHKIGGEMSGVTISSHFGVIPMIMPAFCSSGIYGLQSYY
jgi:hypothetical protein